MPSPLPYFKVNIYPWTRIVSECGLLKISVNETDTTTCGILKAYFTFERK
jgi:hypothetical protein